MIPYTHTIAVGFEDAAIMKELKLQLLASLAAKSDPSIELDPANPCFDKSTEDAVRLFQARNTDSAGHPLKQDGIVGPLTWVRLFGAGSVHATTTASSALLERVLQIAAGEEARRVREVPRNSNDGPDVRAYLGAAGGTAGQPWCCAFVYWCFNQASGDLGLPNPMYRTTGCLDLWRHAEESGVERIPSFKAIDEPGQVLPGMIFIIDHGGGKGHAGLVEGVAGGLLTTIEGNTDASLTREGGGVYRLRRKTIDINCGFIGYR